MADVKFFRGENATLKFYQNGKPVYLACKNWSVDQNATECADGVNGEMRDRLDIVTNYFSASADIFQSDQSVMQKLMDAQSIHDAAGLPPNQSGAIQIRHRDGTKANYLLKGMTVGPWGMNNSGRADAVMLNVKMRFEKFDPVQSAF